MSENHQSSLRGAKRRSNLMVKTLLFFTLIISFLIIYMHFGHPYAYLYQQTEHPTYLSKHLSHHPDDYFGHITLARVNFQDAQYARAADSFSQAYSLDQTDEILLVEYATALYLSGERGGTLQQLLQTIRSLDVLPIASYSLLANVAMDEGDMASAKAYWQQLLDALPDDSPQREMIKKLNS